MMAGEAFWWVFITILAVAVWLVAVWTVTLPSGELFVVPASPPLEIY